MVAMDLQAPRTRTALCIVEMVWNRFVVDGWNMDGGVGFSNSQVETLKLHKADLEEQNMNLKAKLVQRLAVLPPAVAKSKGQTSSPQM
jgi:hypothetical protein